MSDMDEDFMYDQDDDYGLVSSPSVTKVKSASQPFVL